jgi:hypothetical protein
MTYRSYTESNPDVAAEIPYFRTESLKKFSSLSNDREYDPCSLNRAKIDDFIAIDESDNRALNRDKPSKLTIFLYCSR